MNENIEPQSTEKRTKTGGRKKGVCNVITTDIRDRLKIILTGQMENLEADLSDMRPMQRWDSIWTIEVCSSCTISYKD